MTDTPAERDDRGRWVRHAWARLGRRKVAQWGLAYAAGLDVHVYVDETRPRN